MVKSTKHMVINKENAGIMKNIRRPSIKIKFFLKILAPWKNPKQDKRRNPGECKIHDKAQQIYEDVLE